MNGMDMRFAILTPFSSSQFVGGVEVFNTQLQQALGPADIFAGVRPPSVLSHFLDRTGLRQPYDAYRNVHTFLYSHRRRPYDLVISNGVYGWPLVIRRLSVPAIQVYHFTMAGLSREALRLAGDQLTTGVVTAIFDGLAGWGKRVVAVSRRVLSEVESYYRLRGTVIPNAVDTDLFRGGNPGEARRTLGIPEAAVTGIFVGRQEFAKGFDIVTQVCKSLPDVYFLLVGAIRHSGPNVRVLRNVPYEAMPLCYAAADFFFLPSRYEGFNLSVLEALASNVPIVVSKSAYPLADPPKQYGRVVSVHDAERYVEAIKDVLDRLNEFSPRVAVEPNYSLERFKERWRALASSLVECG